MSVSHLAFAALLACAPAASGCGAAPERPAEKSAPASSTDVQLTEAALAAAQIRTGHVRRAPRRTVVMVTGSVDFVPSRVARVGPLTEGRVLSVKVEPGQAVDAGAVLASVQSIEAGKARGDYLAAGVRLKQADTELARQEALAKDSLASGQALQAARTERLLAQEAVRAAREQLQLLGADGSPVVTLRTPLAGSVLSMTARVGQTVSATDTLFVVGKTDEVWLVVDVYERDLARVKVGDEARVSVIAWPNRTFTGKVGYLDGVVDPVRHSVSARVVLANGDGALRPGMTASARIVGTELKGEEASFLPHGAVQTIDGLPFVFVEKAKGRYELRPVERGGEVDGEVEIVRGVSANDVVAIEGTFILKSEYLRDQMGKND